MQFIRIEVLGILLALAMIGCGGTQQYTAQGQNRAAGADGEIHIERQETGNFIVETAIEHLLPPERFGDGFVAYAVWFQAPEEQPQRMGHLDYDEGDRFGEMMATTSLTNFEVIVTGEDSESATSPSEHIVFRAAVSAPN